MQQARPAELGGTRRSAEARGVTYSAGGRSLPCTTAVNTPPPISARQSSRCDPVGLTCAPESRRRRKVRVQGQGVPDLGCETLEQYGKEGEGRRVMFRTGWMDSVKER